MTRANGQEEFLANPLDQLAAVQQDSFVINKDGEAHLLELRVYRGITILTPMEYLQRVLTIESF